MFKKKSNAGRKKLPNGEKQDCKIIFGIKQNELDRLDKLSGQENVGYFCRKIIRDFLRGQDNE